MQIYCALFQKIPLYKGCLVRISVTARAKLRALDRDSNAQPKDYVYAIMDDIFTPEVMANMTAKGKTKGSTQIDAKILDCLLGWY